MNTVQFDSIGMIKQAWTVFQSNIASMLAGYLVIQIILSASAYTFIGVLILTGPCMLGLFKTALRASRGETTEFVDVFAGFQNFVPALVVGILYTLATVIGSILCIVPGILAAILLTPAYFILAERNLPPVENLQASFDMVKANFGQWFILCLILAVFNIVVAIPTCGLGTLVSGPMSLIALAMAYDQAQRA